ncbi:MAG: high-potential iron-sulfur protein [Rhodothermales bacterium]|nr:high-potential iron-sulfur protein [Rhodothermales bacterium]
MKDDQSLSRRNFLQRLGVLGAAGLGASSLLAACGGDDAGEADMDADAGMDAGDDAMTTASCDDVANLTEAQVQQRQQAIQNLEYVAETPQEGKVCSNCQLYQADAYANPCGGCQIIPGPVAADGYCNSWVAATQS